MKNSIIQRSWFARLLCIWLAVSVLLGSSGFIIVDHWCLMSGKKVESRLMAKECIKACKEEATCPQQAATPKLHKTPCCKEVARYENLKTEQSSPVHSAKLSPAVTDIPEFSYFFEFLQMLLPADRAASAPHQPDDPLVRSGRFRLVALCTWLI